MNARCSFTAPTIKSSSKNESCFVIRPLAVLYKLTVAPPAPALPVCTEVRGAVSAAF